MVERDSRRVLEFIRGYSPFERRPRPTPFAVQDVRSPQASEYLSQLNGFMDRHLGQVSKFFFIASLLAIGAGMIGLDTRGEFVAALPAVVPGTIHFLRALGAGVRHLNLIQKRVQSS